MSTLLGPRDENGIPVPMTVDESIASMKASLLKKIKRSAYVYRVDCGGCNGCEIEIFATLSPLFDAERFGIKVVPSPRHADILLFTGAVTRAMRSPALRAWQSAPDPKICISYGACGNSGGIFHDGCASIAKRGVWRATAMDGRLPMTICVCLARATARCCAGWRRRKIRV
ncbi:MAG: hypothetical protein E7E45_11190 [Klebsiella pneumoniae]|nr:hypothetical protein [Klebsiella pneumoniae]